MSNWGIDNWICDVYKSFNSCYINSNLTMLNHVGNKKERYIVDIKFRKKLDIEIKHYSKIIKKYYKIEFA